MNPSEGGPRRTPTVHRISTTHTHTHMTHTNTHTHTHTHTSHRSQSLRLHTPHTHKLRVAHEVDAFIGMWLHAGRGALRYGLAICARVQSWSSSSSSSSIDRLSEGDDEQAGRCMTPCNASRIAVTVYDGVRHRMVQSSEDGTSRRRREELRPSDVSTFRLAPALEQTRQRGRSPGARDRERGGQCGGDGARELT